MPLIECPDCKKQISDLAPSCINCGRPMKVPETNINESSNYAGPVINGRGFGQANNGGSLAGEELLVKVVKQGVQNAVEDALIPSLAGKLVWACYNGFTDFLARQNAIVRFVIIVAVGALISITLDSIFPVSDLDYLNGKKNIGSIFGKGFLYITLAIVLYKSSKPSEVVDAEPEFEQDLSGSETDVVELIAKKHFSEASASSEEAFIMFCSNLIGSKYCLKCYDLIGKSELCEKCNFETIVIDQKTAYQIGRIQFKEYFDSYDAYLKAYATYIRNEKIAAVIGVLAVLAGVAYLLLK